jgi:hypothetical protein
VNEQLMEALLHAALFFETSSDRECDPDLAVKQLEEISASLRQLARADQDQFRSFAERAAERQPSAVVAGEIRRLVEGLLPLDEETSPQGESIEL